MREPFEQDREDFAVGERFDRESTDAEELQAIILGAEQEEEEEERLRNRREFDKALRNYAASVKRYGKALVDLGRACDGKEAS